MTCGRFLSKPICCATNFAWKMKPKSIACLRIHLALRTCCQHHVLASALGKSLTVWYLHDVRMSYSYVWDMWTDGVVSTPGSWWHPVTSRWWKTAEESSCSTAKECIWSPTPSSRSTASTSVSVPVWCCTATAPWWLWSKVTNELIRLAWSHIAG